MSKIPELDDAKDLLSAIRLGWSMAETRGRNRPDGPSGEVVGLPDQKDHPLPLGIERSPAELRIEAQSVVAALAKELHVDDPGTDVSFGAELQQKAMLLEHVRAGKATGTLRAALGLLQTPPGRESDPATAALTQLQSGLLVQQAVLLERQQAVAAARQALARAQQRVTELAGHPAKAAAAAARAVTKAETAVRLEQACRTGENAGLTALTEVIEILQQATESDPQTAVQTGAAAITERLQRIATAAQQPWADLADLIWRFDAHVQDGLTAASETSAIGYQLGRGLAETYWALDPADVTGSTGWSFLLGSERCGELTRLVGRLAPYLNKYTPPAIAGSVEVWKEVARTPAWRGEGTKAEQDLYSQIRRWFELIILGQDPATLINPGAMIKNYRAVGRAMKLFLPQLVELLVGLGFLVALLVYLSIGGSTVQKTFSGVLAFAGLSVAGITGTVKNSTQGVLGRLRQDVYTDLVAIAVQTAPPPPRKSDIRKAVGRRGLTPGAPG